MAQRLQVLKEELGGAEFKATARLLAASLAMFLVFKVFVVYPLENVHTAFGAGALLLAGLGFGLRMADFVLPARIVLRTIFGLFGFYVLAAYPTMPAEGLNAFDAALLSYGRFPAAALALAALWRPSLGLVMLGYVLWFKAKLGQFIGADLSVTDYMPLIEVAAFLVIARMVQAGFERRGWMGPLPAAGVPTGEKFFLLAVAVHLANYFYSALKKIEISDYPWGWIAENKTQALIANAWAYKQLPVSFSPELTLFSYENLAAVVVLSNALLFSGQVFALFALLRVRWAIWTTLFYDLTHAVIFVLNLSIVMALETMKKRVITPALALMLMGMVLVAPLFFFVAHLGWWDTPQTNIEYFEAVTKDGKTARVPSNYFGSFSVVVAQQRLIFDKSHGFLPTSTYGLTRDPALMRQALDCTVPVGAGDVIAETFAQPDNTLEAFVKRYHSWVLGHAVDENGHWLFDLYPHHIFSSFWEFPEFNRLNLNDIVAYRYIVEAACVHEKDGALRVDVIKKGQHDIRIQ
jgi:hypothetical protein